MDTPLQYLRKVVAIRRNLIRQGKSYRDVAEMEQSLAPFERWLQFWNGKATDQGALTMIKSHADQIRDIIPGGNSGCAPALIKNLEYFLSLNNNTMKQWNFPHEGVEYRALYTIDEVDQKIELKAIQLTTDKTNIIGMVSHSIIAGIRSHLESKHLTHAA